jgi:hypothetical protein
MTAGKRIAVPFSRSCAHEPPDPAFKRFGLPRHRDFPDRFKLGASAFAPITSIHVDFRNLRHLGLPAAESVFFSLGAIAIWGYFLSLQENWVQSQNSMVNSTSGH